MGKAGKERELGETKRRERENGEELNQVRTKTLSQMFKSRQGNDGRQGSST